MPAPASTDSPRSEATRQRLLDAGLALFSNLGFDRVSTRELARAAGVNQAAIPYHFQSKEGLYHAVAARVVETVQPAIEPVIETIRERHRDGVTDPGRAREDVAALIVALLREILSQPERGEIGHFIIREQMHPTAAMDILYDGMMQPLHEMLARLVSRLRGKPAGDPEVVIEVLALVGQAIVFGVHRTTLVRRLAVDRLDEDHLRRIEAVVRDMVMRQFPL